MLQVPGIIAEVDLPHQTTLEDHTHNRQADYSGTDAKQSRLKIVPFTTPYLLYACIEDSLQVGT